MPTKVHKTSTWKRPSAAKTAKSWVPKTCGLLSTPWMVESATTLRSPTHQNFGLPKNTILPQFHNSQDLTMVEKHHAGSRDFFHLLAIPFAACSRQQQSVTKFTGVIPSDVTVFTSNSIHTCWGPLQVWTHCYKLQIPLWFSAIWQTEIFIVAHTSPVLLRRISKNVPSTKFHKVMLFRKQISALGDCGWNSNETDRPLYMFGAVVFAILCICWETFLRLTSSPERSLFFSCLVNSRSFLCITSWLFVSQFIFQLFFSCAN